MKAMILAAGRGNRMRPLTDSTPKPLLKVKDEALIVHHLKSLAQNNVREVVINVHYHAQQIYHALGDGSQFGVRIHYSYEPELLETGGGIVQALTLLNDAPFIVLSADLWTDYSWRQLPTQMTSLAHLIMVDNPAFHPQGDFYLRHGKLFLEGEPKLTYANIGVFHPNLFKNCKPEPFKLNTLLFPAITRGEITGEYFHGCWENIGTPEQLAKLNIIS